MILKAPTDLTHIQTPNAAYPIGADGLIDIDPGSPDIPYLLEKGFVETDHPPIEAISGYQPEHRGSERSEYPGSGERAGQREPASDATSEFPSSASGRAPRTGAKQSKLPGHRPEGERQEPGE